MGSVLTIFQNCEWDYKKSLALYEMEKTQIEHKSRVTNEMIGYLKGDDSDMKIAKYYLMEADYDIVKAKKQYDQDLKGEMNQLSLAQLEQMNKTGVDPRNQYQTYPEQKKNKNGYFTVSGNDFEEEQMLIKKNQ